MHQVFPFLLFVLIFPLKIEAQEDFYFEDFVYVDNIRSVKFNPVNDVTGFPITKLSNGTRLQLSFDDLDPVDKRYTYRLIHCDRDWNETDLDEMEYLEGFNGEEITNSYHSMQTRKMYVHYDLFLPNQYMEWKISGNYLLVIYDEDDMPVITKRFLVVDPQVSVFADIVNPKKISQLKSHHSLKININHEDFYIRDPLNEVSVTVLQNFKWFDAIYNVKPKNTISNALNFDVFDPFVFPALKEFRNFDIRSLVYTSRYVYSIRASSEKVDVTLETDKKRTYSNFMSESDINGNYIIDNKDNQTGVRGAEYVNVTFNLESPLPIDDHDVYVLGAFSDWQLYETNKMEYNTSASSYTADILLKQGFYDYYYALVNNDGEINLSSLEGNWYETDNTYYILVYLREFGSYYDKLVAMYALK